MPRMRTCYSSNILIKIVNDIEIFLSLGSLCSVDSCAAHGVHVILPINIILSMTNEEKKFLLLTQNC